MIKVRTKLCFKTSPASWPFTFQGRSLLYQLFFLNSSAFSLLISTASSHHLDTCLAGTVYRQCEETLFESFVLLYLLLCFLPFTSERA